MALVNTCPYCGAAVSNKDLNCPHCGASNEYYIAETSRLSLIPKTIGELKEFCEQRKIPLAKMRFFVGENFKQPRAYGIYRDGDRFIVYKNKSDGTRAIRYDGPDEVFAVRELFLKLSYEVRTRGI